jgi:hypothetical protein
VEHAAEVGHQDAVVGTALEHVQRAVEPVEPGRRLAEVERPQLRQLVVAGRLGHRRDFEVYHLGGRCQRRPHPVRFDEAR